MPFWQLSDQLSKRLPRKKYRFQTAAVKTAEIKESAVSNLCLDIKDKPVRHSATGQAYGISDNENFTEYTSHRICYGLLTDMN